MEKFLQGLKVSINEKQFEQQHRQTIFEDSLKKLEAMIQEIKDQWMQGSYKNNEQMIAYDAKTEACQSMELRNKKKSCLQ